MLRPKNKGVGLEPCFMAGCLSRGGSLKFLCSLTLQFKWPNSPESSDRTTCLCQRKNFWQYIPPSTFDSLLGIYNFERVVGRFGGREKGKKETFVLFIPCGTPRKLSFRTAARRPGKPKGQLISECLFDNLQFSKKPTKNLTNFCPRI